MKNVELYGRVRYAVQIEGLSERAAARRYGIDPRTVHKMMKFSVPPALCAPRNRSANARSLPFRALRQVMVRFVNLNPPGLIKSWKI